MLVFSVVTGVLALARIGLSTPSKRPNDFVVKHRWEEIPKGWQWHSPAPGDHTLEMRIGLKQDRLDELISTLYQVSDPGNARYGAHLSKEEVDALVAPHPTTLFLVESWLAGHGIDASAVEHSGASSWLTVDVSVSQAESMLNTKYGTYFNPSTSSYVHRTLEYSLPRELHGHVDVISPATYFGSTKEMKAASFLMPKVGNAAEVEEDKLEEDKLEDASATCSSNSVTLACLRSLYNFAGYTPKAASKNKLGITGYLKQYASHADLQTFFKMYRPDAVGTTFKTVKVNGGLNDQTNPGIEASLDIQYGAGISSPTPNIFYSTGGSPPFKPDQTTPTNTNEPYLNWLHYILNQKSIPQTISTSYGDDEQTVPFDYAKSVCNLFVQLGARGSSVMFSSGDDGVGAGDCLSNDGTHTERFQPNFPASCPYVTTVGGTTGAKPEVAASFSSGGFSNYFAQPSYQSSAVAKYLKFLGNKLHGQYNATGRAYPDVAAQAEGFQVVLGGTVQSVGGTSCSSPTFAAIVALLNDHRLASDKAPLGFLNPFLYSAGYKGLNDITSGSNPGCNTAGFNSTSGWDPVTGLGTPNFGLLQKLI